MKFGVVLLAASLLTFLAPTVVADGCSGDASAIAVGPLYLGTDGTLWQESNNLAGLQRAPCSDDNGRDHAADAQLL